MNRSHSCQPSLQILNRSAIGASSFELILDGVQLDIRVILNVNWISSISRVCVQNSCGQYHCATHSQQLCPDCVTSVDSPMDEDRWFFSATNQDGWGSSQSTKQSSSELYCSVLTGSRWHRGVWGVDMEESDSVWGRADGKGWVRGAGGAAVSQKAAGAVHSWAKNQDLFLGELFIDVNLHQHINVYWCKFGIKYRLSDSQCDSHLR